MTSDGGYEAMRNPQAQQLAEHHADAISDTGDGYSVRRRNARLWEIRCLWCEWSDGAATKRDAEARYRQHEDEVLAVLRAGK